MARKTPAGVVSPPSEVAEFAGQAVVEKTVNKAGTKPEPKPLAEAVVAGYGVDDILKSPAKPPEPKISEAKEATSNLKVVIVILIGLLLGVVGLALLFIALPAGLFIMLLGALVIIFGVYAPVGYKPAKNKKPASL